MTSDTIVIVTLVVIVLVLLLGNERVRKGAAAALSILGLALWFRRAKPTEEVQDVEKPFQPPTPKINKDGLTAIDKKVDDATFHDGAGSGANVPGDVEWADKHRDL